MRAKSVDELRASNRARQKRWRDRHRWLARERKLACYGQSAGQKKEVAAGGVRPPVSNNETGKAPNVTSGYEELHYGPVWGYDQMEPDRRGGHREVKIALEVPRGTPLEEEEPNERATYARLAELVKRQREGRLNAGVEVDLEL